MWNQEPQHNIRGAWKQRDKKWSLRCILVAAKPSTLQMQQHGETYMVCYSCGVLLVPDEHLWTESFFCGRETCFLCTVLCKKKCKQNPSKFAAFLGFTTKKEQIFILREFAAKYHWSSRWLLFLILQIFKQSLHLRRKLTSIAQVKSLYFVSGSFYLGMQASVTFLSPRFDCGHLFYHGHEAN